MAESSYLRFPHLAQNLLTFVAADDVWLAPVDAAAEGGARAWRLTADRAPAAHPRLSPAGTHVAWTSRRDGAGEAYAAPVEGGLISRLTYWNKQFRAPADRNGDAAISVDLDRIRVMVDPGAEWRQMYDENWRLLRDNFWRADMGGLDWAALGERYRPLLDRIGSTDDLHDLLSEVGAELGTSHAYVLPPQHRADPALAQGLLGADFARDADGTWRISRILPAENSVTRGRSPLRALGVAAVAGDAIVAVDGRPVDTVRGPDAALAGKADKPVELTLRRDGAQDRRVVVVPLADETTLRYQDLVRSRRAQVHELSGGRLGYVHVPDMVSSGWAEYHRDLHREIGREGLLVDFRSNNGGHTSELVLEKLTRKLIGWGTYLEVEPLCYPTDAPRGPLVALADECSGSDGDIVTHAFRRADSVRSSACAPGAAWSASTTSTRSSTAPRPRSRSWRSGSTTASPGAWRTTASNPTWRSRSRRRTGRPDAIRNCSRPCASRSKASRAHRR